MKRLAVFALAAILAGCAPKDATLFVGTYGEAIHVMSYDMASGEMAETGTIPAKNPSFVALSGQSLYAVSERGAESGVYSFKRTDAGWQQTAHLLETAADPCHLLPVDGAGILVTADYSGGAFTVFSTGADGLEERVQQATFESRYAGAPPVAGNQDSAHIHQIREIPASMLERLGVAGRYLLVSDLGNDLIRIEQVAGGCLVGVDTVECGPGAGPRHMEFNESAGLVYCVTELSGEVIVWRIGAEGGVPSLAEVQRLKADGFDAGGSADIHLHPSGRWLYTSHRLQGDGISVMAVGPDGLLSKTSYTPTGTHPRNFCFSPDGARLLVACRDSRSIEVFDICEADGSLSGPVFEYTLSADKPVCLLFAD